MYRALHRNGRTPLLGHASRVVLLAIAGAVAALALLAPARAGAATVPAGMMGMNDWTPPNEQTLSTVSRAGVKRWRAGMFWYMVEPNRGTYDWSHYDAMVSSAARQNVSMLMVLAGCTYWACGELTGPPKAADKLAAQQSFVRAAVARYGSSGSFWASHPELPRRPVTDWQVWNEVNSSTFYKPAPDPAGYARLLRSDAAAIRSADPHATVVMSGLTRYGQVPVSTYLRGLYAQPGFKQSFDVMALHAYEPNTPAIAKLINGARGVMAANGDAGRPTWITEMGWGTSSPALRTPTTEAQQAALMSQSFDMLIGCRSRWNVSRAYWFSFRDTAPQPGHPDDAGNHTGLFARNGRAKPAWGTLQQYRDGAGLPGGRGNACDTGGSAVKAPQTKIRSRKRFHRTRRAKLRFVSSQRRSRFQCRLIKAGQRKRSHAAKLSRKWRRCKGRYRTKRLRRGRYRLEVRAVNAARVADRSPAKARLTLKRSRRVTISVRVLRGHRHNSKHRR